MTLQVAVGLRSDLGIKGLTFGILLPRMCRTLVATDVDVIKREESDQLINDILRKLDGFGRSDVHDIA